MKNLGVQHIDRLTGLRVTPCVLVKAQRIELACKIRYARWYGSLRGWSVADAPFLLVVSLGGLNLIPAWVWSTTITQNGVVLPRYEVAKMQKDEEEQMKETEHSKPPWTDQQLKSLNDYQAYGSMHPFTGESGGPLIATRDGWIEKDGGPVVQTWAHSFMADDTWRKWERNVP
jgi:hypothetical protein